MKIEIKKNSDGTFSLFVDGKFMSSGRLSEMIKLAEAAETKEKIVCPVCGKEMDETYRGNQYCYECERKLKN